MRKKNHRFRRRSRPGWWFWGMAHRNITVVRRKFRTHYKLTPKYVPPRMAFQRLVDRFIESNGHVHPQLAAVGRPHFQEDLAERIGDFPNRQSVSKRRNLPPAASHEKVVARDSKICVIMLVSTRRRNSPHHNLSSGQGPARASSAAVSSAA